MTNEKAFKLAEVADTLRELATLAQRLADLVSGLAEIEPQPSPTNERLESEGQPHVQPKKAVPEPLKQAATRRSLFPPEAGKKGFRRQVLGMPPRQQRERLRSRRNGRSHRNGRQPVFLLGQRVQFQNESLNGTYSPDLMGAKAQQEKVKAQRAKIGFDPAAMQEAKAWSGGGQGNRNVMEPQSPIAARRGHGGENEDGGGEDGESEPTEEGVRIGLELTPSLNNSDLEYGLQYNGRLGSDRNRGP